MNDEQTPEREDLRSTRESIRAFDKRFSAALGAMVRRDARIDNRMIADAIGQSSAHFANLKRGDGLLSIGRFKAIADRLGLSLDDLYARVQRAERYVEQDPEDRRKKRGDEAT